MRIAEAAEIVLKESAGPMHARDMAVAIAQAGEREMKIGERPATSSESVNK